MIKREVGHPTSLFFIFMKNNEHKFKTICIFAAEKFQQDQGQRYNRNSITLITKTIQI